MTEEPQNDQVREIQIALASLAAGIKQEMNDMRVDMRVEVANMCKQMDAMHHAAENVDEARSHPAHWGRQSRGESSSFSEGIYTKGLRLEFPCFNGEDLDSWCYIADQFFEFYDIFESQRLSITTINA
jgi:hypothetical protein